MRMEDEKVWEPYSENRYLKLEYFQAVSQASSLTARTLRTCFENLLPTRPNVCAFAFSLHLRTSIQREATQNSSYIQENTDSGARLLVGDPTFAIKLCDAGKLLKLLEFGGEWIHVQVWLGPFPVHMKLSQHCKLAVLQYKIKSFKKITQPLRFSDFTRKIRGNSSFQFSRKIGNGCLPKPMRSPHLTIPFAYIHILKIHKQNIPGEFLALPEVKGRCLYFSIIYSCCYLVTHSCPTLLQPHGL